MTFLEVILTCWQHIKDKLPKKSKRRFPLLKLPIVVLLECIEHLDVLEIILFSLLSKRAKSFTELIRWNPPVIHLTTGQQIQLKLSTDPGVTWIIAYVNYKELSKYPYFQSNIMGPEVNHFLLLKDNGTAVEDIKQMMEHICEVFRSPIFGITIFNESLIEWLINFQPTIQSSWVCKDVISVKTLERISKSLKVKQFLGFDSVEIDEKFQFTETLPCTSISIHNSFWITLPSILNGTHSIIRLYGAELSPVDINVILKEWYLGSKLCDLEYMVIHTTTLLDTDSYVREMFKDLNMTISVTNDGRPTTVKLNHEWTITLPDEELVNNLTRSDGKILSIFGHYELFADEKTKIFLNLQVWRQQS